MDQLVFPVAVVGSVATALMIVGMLYLVWISMGDDRHAPALDGERKAETPEVEGETEGDAPELAESSTA